MIVNDKDAIARLNSPMNLMNRLAASKNSKRGSAMDLFGVNRKTTEVKIAFNPFEAKPSESSETPAEQTALVPSESSAKLSDILENHESQIKLGLAHDRSLDLLTRSVDALASKLDDVKADKLPSVISAASKVVESIRRERNEASKNSKDREVHYHFYTPEQKKLQEYEVIDVGV